MANFSYNTNGPMAQTTPRTTPGPTFIQQTTPADKALQSAQMSSAWGMPAKAPGILSTNVASNTAGSTTPSLAQPAAPKMPGLIPPTNQPIKSHTTVDAAGNKTTQTYHQPPVDTKPTSTPAPQKGITGNTTTPSGAVVNADTGATVSAPSQDNTYAGLIARLADATRQNQAYGQQAADIGKKYGQQIADVGMMGARQGVGYLSTGTKPVGEGNALLNANAVSQQQSALTQGAKQELEANAQQLTGQSQTQTGLTSAGNLAAPIQVPYSAQVINPATGQPVTSGTTGSLQDAVKGVVEKLTAGTMTYNDAVSALSGYGQGGVNALQQALPPGFNIAQSNALVGQQGTVGVNYQLANNALMHVEEVMKQLGVLQKTNIPGINYLVNWGSTVTGIGSAKTREMTGAVQSLRNAYASLIASSTGGTPTAYSDQAQAEIPDQPTQNDLAAIRSNFEKLGKARASILGNPGQATGTGTTGAQGAQFDANGHLQAVSF